MLYDSMERAQKWLLPSTASLTVSPCGTDRSSSESDPVQNLSILSSHRIPSVLQIPCHANLVPRAVPPFQDVVLFLNASMHGPGLLQSLGTYTLFAWILPSLTFSQSLKCSIVIISSGGTLQIATAGSVWSSDCAYTWLYESSAVGQRPSPQGVAR
jgi:hypothetical protein